MVTVRWHADLGHLAAIRRFVGESGRSLGADEAAIRDLELAVDEICSNSIRHGYGAKEGQLEITVERVGHSIKVVVRDWGRAFDPGQIPVPDPAVPLEDRSLGGLGLFLVHQVMDEVRFEFNDSKGNSVTVFRKLNREGKE